MLEWDIVILPSFAAVDNWRKRHATSRSSGLFGQVVTTFESWISALWELHGDGRAPIDPIRREVVMHAVFQGGGGKPAHSGFAPLASACMREAAGVPQFQRALDAVRRGGELEGVSEREREVLSLLGEYEDQLDSLGFVELGVAAKALAEKADEVFPRSLNVLMPDAGPLSWIQQRFFASCPQLALTHHVAPGSEGVQRAPEDVEVTFAFPSGRLAEPGVIVDIIRSSGADEGVVVACKDPLALCEQLESSLADEGFNVCVQASKPFAHTDFGKAFLAHYHCLHDEPWNPSLLIDAILSPFSGFGREDALRIDSELRGNRLAERDESLGRLYALSEPFSQLGELATDPEADVLIGVFEQMVRSSARTSSWKSEQLAALGALRAAAVSARGVKGGIGICAAVLENASLPVSFQIEGDGPKVVITTQHAASQMEGGCCSVLVAADLTAEDYPVSSREDAAFTLLSKLGLLPRESALSQARREFRALLRLPRKRIELVRPLADSNAEDTYPSAVLEEFVDAYRSDPSATDDIDNLYRLPSELQGGLVERGEELLFANARAARHGAYQPLVADESMSNCHSERQRRISSVTTQGDSSGFAPRMTGEAFVMENSGMADVPSSALRFNGFRGRAAGASCPSPSQIEAYLECPYRWFATRLLCIDALDEGFGPLERGAFAHSALERFYKAFTQSGHPKVNADNLDEAREVMRDVLAELASEQPLVDPREKSRLVPINELERREVQALCEALVGYLDYEAQLLPTFHPAYLEYRIEPSSGVDYAGYPFSGVVDRIDVDGLGHAVIIDYKGSVSEEHEIKGKTAAHAGKVQTRIYAQVVKRALNLDVVGVLYVGYGSKPSSAGAYDPRVLEAAHLPNMRHDNCTCGLIDEIPDPRPDDLPLSELSFNRMLDATEDIAGSAIADMADGMIAPRPSSAKACDHCPVLACVKRGA